MTSPLFRRNMVIHEHLKHLRLPVPLPAEDIRSATGSTRVHVILERSGQKFLLLY